VNQYAVSMGTNSLMAIREELHRWKGPARMVWGMKDVLFGVQWAEWLDRTPPGSRGVRRVEGTNLFFPEEMTEVIAEEAARLWAFSVKGTQKETFDGKLRGQWN
jgi:haloalkane dehalogenase